MTCTEAWGRFTHPKAMNATRQEGFKQCQCMEVNVKGHETTQDNSYVSGEVSLSVQNLSVLWAFDRTR
jgi:hypothetical protein